MKKKIEKKENYFKKLFKGKRKFIWLIVILGIGGGIFLKFKNNGDKDEELQTTKVLRENLVASISASGQVISSGTMEISTQASGVVKIVYVKEGDTVAAGTKIMDIELDQSGKQKQAQTWASYLSAKNNLESAKINQYSLHSDLMSDWDSFKQLSETDTYEDANSENRTLPEFIISENSWLESEAKYKNQEQTLAQIQASLSSSWISYQLASATVVAPAAGVVKSISYIEGMNINNSSDSSDSSSSTKIGVIETDARVLASFNLSEIDVSSVQVGQKATVILDSLSEQSFVGKVVNVDRVGTVTSNVTQYPVIIELTEASDDILPNMVATANIIIDMKENVLTLPVGALVIDGENTTVTLVKDGQIQNVLVETGLENETKVEIVSGLSEGDEIIVRGSAYSSSSNSGMPGMGGGGPMMMMR